MERECPDSLNADKSHEFKLSANSLVTGGHGVMARCGYCGDLLQEYVIERVLNNALKPSEEKPLTPEQYQNLRTYRDTGRDLTDDELRRMEEYEINADASEHGLLPTAEAAVHLYNLATKGGNEGIKRAEFKMDDGGRVIVLGDQQAPPSDPEEHLE